MSIAAQAFVPRNAAIVASNAKDGATVTRVSQTPLRQLAKRSELFQPGFDVHTTSARGSCLPRRIPQARTVRCPRGALSLSPIVRGFGYSHPASRRQVPFQSRVTAGLCQGQKKCPPLWGRAFFPDIIRDRSPLDGERCSVTKLMPVWFLGTRSEYRTCCNPGFRSQRLSRRRSRFADPTGSTHETFRTSPALA